MSCHHSNAKRARSLARSSQETPPPPTPKPPRPGNPPFALLSWTVNPRSNAGNALYCNRCLSVTLVPEFRSNLLLELLLEAIRLELCGQDYAKSFIISVLVSRSPQCPTLSWTLAFLPTEKARTHFCRAEEGDCLPLPPSKSKPRCIVSSDNPA